jgi:uncharacterized protein (TIGR00725 family)
MFFGDSRFYSEDLMHIARDAVRIAVIGERNTSQSLMLEAQQIGREIAQRGGILVCGGMGGVMEAASRGCSEAGGTVIGIIPTEHAADANRHISIPVVTGFGEGRNIIIVRSAHAVIAIGGSYGTLSEIALALRLDIPVIGVAYLGVFSRAARRDRPNHQSCDRSRCSRASLAIGACSGQFYRTRGIVASWSVEQG